jgi:hypothetical protein|tara:strand:- start:881 stop:1111 length:231 start_codon:yes stop_codon:yes gene_type:complete
MPKTDEQFLKDRLDMFETEGWRDLVSDLKITEGNVRDIRTLESEKDLWHAKGQLEILRQLHSLEDATKLAVEQSDS